MGDELTIADAKEIRVNCTSTVFRAASWQTVDGVDYTMTNRGRNQHMAKLILSRCSMDVRNGYHEARRSFFTNKSSKGKSFLDKLRKVRKTGYINAFNVKGDRLTTRKKKDRARQLAADATPLTLPAVAGREPLVTTTLLASRRSKGDAKFPLWFPCDPSVLDHLTFMAQQHFDHDDDNESPAHPSEERQSENGDATSDEDRDDGSDNAAEDVDNEDADVDDRVNNADNDDERDAVVVSFPIFRAFQRGAAAN